MIRQLRIKKAIAIFFLGLLTTETLLPAVGYALTNGPQQPEATRFEPAGTSDMVDLFTGDFKYNIPLLDIDGYPVNLSYKSGTGMDDEASWVGLGWSLNAGAITRQLRGLPDDMSGDLVKTEQYLKPKITTGGRATVRAELLGKGRFGLNGSISLGVFNDTYTGMGAEFGANAGISFNISNGSRMTGNMALSARLGIGVNSNTSSGVNVSPSLSLSLHERTHHFIDNILGPSANLTYNTREGLKERTLGVSFGTVKRDYDANRSGEVEIFGNTVSYSTPSYYPSPSASFVTTNSTYSLDVGGSAFGIYGGIGATGYQTRREIDDRFKVHPAYGMLYAERSAKKADALLDFMREKDNPVIPNMPSLAIPIATPDLFTYTSQTGGGQFRVYRGGTGVFADEQSRDISSNTTLGGDFGYGGYFHNGVSYYKQESTTQTGKWVKDNNFLNVGDFSSNKTDRSDEYAYLKEIGELNAADAGFTAQLQEEKAVSVFLNGKSTTGSLKDDYVAYPVSGQIKKSGRQIRSNSVTYLTAGEYKAAFEEKINSYNFIPYSSTPFVPAACAPQSTGSRPRVNGDHRQDHISEITVHGKDGGRMIYGIPVYNNSQDEYSFAVDKNDVKNGTDVSRNLIAIRRDAQNAIDHKYGTDHYYRKETQPAYATSFLLTGIFSPDYEDLTKDGITPDDPGTAVKFNYSRIDGYKWRSPFQPGMASLNRGVLADPDDDKGNIVTGVKELWYLQSIESKNYVAYFITDDREDGLGVTDYMGVKNTTVKQKRLREIRLFSKDATPKLLKTVVFEYNYSLCPGVPNHMNQTGSGKLTLTGVHFKYQQSQKGAQYPYKFKYNQNNPGYALLSSDRWGTYKGVADNSRIGFPGMRNDEFPYTAPTTAVANPAAQAWQLSEITLPTGGVINVEYEADDYAYVQDRRAMEMSGISALLKGKNSVAANLLEATGLRVKVPGMTAGTSMDVDAFRRDYLDRKEVMYAKLYVNVSDQPGSTSTDLMDYIPAYGKVVDVAPGNGYIDVIFEKDQGYNPFITAAWQKMRLEYPRYAYPGYKNKLGDDVSIKAALAAIVNAVGNLREITENFNERAARKKFASTVLLGRSFARIINKSVPGRLGGGARVRKIMLKDNWDQMATGGKAAVYGQQYEYTIDEGGTLISSGVASYEPLIGADENPFRMPTPSYSQDFKWTLSNYFYLEEPYGESLFPGAQVGYRRVSVYSLGGDENKDPLQKTGYTVSEFYTAKEFPVIVNYTQPDKYNYQPSSWFSFFGGNVIQELIMSQGYSLVLNDMHGKLKANRTFNQSDVEIASEVYDYNAEATGATTFRLKNNVKTIDATGKINNNEIIGREIEVYTDMREQESSITGTSINLGLDVIPFIFGTTLPLPHWPFKENNEYRLFRSASTMKTVQYFGVLSKVTKKVDGSTIVSSNLVYDRNTGAAVVVQSQNEFGDPIYTVNVPAYWVNRKMGAAYQNEGLLIEGFATGPEGVIRGNAAFYLGTIGAGDELRDLKTGERYWIIETVAGGLSSFRVIDANGHLVKGYSGNVKVLHSAYANKLTSSAMSIVCKENPMSANGLGILSNADMASYKVLNASAILYNEDWGAKGRCSECPDGYTYDNGLCYAYPVFNPSDSLTPVGVPARYAYSMFGARLYNADGSGAPPFTTGYWSPVCVPGSSRTTSLKTQEVSQSDVDSVMARKSGSRLAVSAVEDDICGVLSRVGLWLNMTGTLNWKGIEDCFTAPSTGVYYLGFGCDNEIRIFIDGVYIQGRQRELGEDFQYWNLYPVNLTAGSHKIRIEMKNDGGTTGDKSMGVEIYNVSYSELAAGDYPTIALKRIFTTETLKNSTIQTFSIRDDGTEIRRYTAPVGEFNPCTRRFEIASDDVVNPYLKGFLGDWRPSEELVNQSLRANQTVGTYTYAGANIRNTGHFTSFIPYWYSIPGSGVWTSTATSTASNWKSARKITLYGSHGEELENRDPLGNYSAAIYGYRNSVATAVASNSRQREIYYDGFEDYLATTGCVSSECSADRFSLRSQWTPATTTFKPVTTESHTGLYSLELSGSVGMLTKVHTTEHRSTNYLGVNGSGEYQYRTDVMGLYPTGYSPYPGKKYVFSAWVKDNQPASDNPGITVFANGKAVQLKRLAVVEKWKLVEGTFTLTTDENLQILLSPQSGTIYMDDMRVFPFDAHLKSYAYDAGDLRLMAELDENNFATFYEYDDEGGLVRVKKETERGIMTIKENRSAAKRK